jgi:hypothetical protein
MYFISPLFMIVTICANIVIAYSLYNLFKTQQNSNYILNKLLEVLEKKIDQ